LTGCAYQFFEAFLRRAKFIDARPGEALMAGMGGEAFF
jgi:hypothetical protein